MTTPKTGYPDNNPKTAIGVSKAPLHFIPPVAMVHLGLAMEDGGKKYGLMNWREFTVSSSVYYDAIFRHLLSWWDGEDAAHDSGVHHLGHVMACCAILLDAEASLRLNDDRPSNEGFVTELLDRLRKSREAKLIVDKPVDTAAHPRPHTVDFATGHVAADEKARLRELAAREAMHAAYEAKAPDKPPADATNDELKHHSRLNMPSPGAPRMRRGLTRKGSEIWFEDTPILFTDQLAQLAPSAVERLHDLIDAIDGEPFPARWADVNTPEG